MTEKEPLLDGEYIYSFESVNGNELSLERTFEDEFALVKFSGDISDLPKEFKRNITVRKAERFEAGDTLILKDGYVSEFNHEFDYFHVEAHDNRQKVELSLEESALHCPLCGEVFKSEGAELDSFPKCNNCTGLYFDVYGRGEQIVIEGGP